MIEGVLVGAVFLLIPALFITLDRAEVRRKQLIEDSPVCIDCKHCKFLTYDNDNIEWGIRPRYEGYYCMRDPYTVSSGGPEVTGYDEKRVRKCSYVRRFAWRQ